MHVNIFELPYYKSGPITQVSRNTPTSSSLDNNHSTAPTEVSLGEPLQRPCVPLLSGAFQNRH
jgi:hypothetical protein